MGPVGGTSRGYRHTVAMFRLQGSKVLAVDMTGDAVKAKNGSMVAYDGQMAFKKLTGGGEGIRGMVTRRLTGEQMTVMEVKGQGTCWFADRASEINLVSLQGDKLYVESSNLLATDAGLRTGTHLHRAARRLAGQRPVHHDRRGPRPGGDHVGRPGGGAAGEPQYPLTVDPGAYIAHQGNLRQSFQSGVTFRTFMGEGGGEAFQIRFEGDGLVYVQPSERNTIAGDV